MQIRTVGLLASLLLVWLHAAAQSAELARIGFLGNSTAELEANLVGPFQEGLRELGYVEGESIEIEFRWAEGDYSRLPALIAELIAAKVDVIVTAGTPASLAVKNATSSVPLVMIAVGDPVATGLVPSLARPGGNVTGLTSIAGDLEGKRLELLREVVPGLSHVAVFWNPANAIQVKLEQEVQNAAAALQIKVLSLGVRSKDDIAGAFPTILEERPQGLLVLADRLFLHHRQLIMDFAATEGLPGVHAYRELVEAGGLMSYGPSYAEMHRRAAWYVDRILKGADPAELPVEGPSMFELVVNLKAAEALGLELPPSLVARATEVIE